MIRVGQVGIGQWGKNHLKILSQMQGVELVGGYDTNPSVVFINKYDNLPRLINDSDALVIASPTKTHYLIAKLALENGVHVFIEKPVCTEVWQAEELAKLSNGSIVQVGHIERFNPAYQRFKKEDAKHLSPVCKRFGKPGRKLDDSVVMDLMIHDIDLILDLAQSSVEKIAASITRKDIVLATVTFKNGIVALLQASHILKRKRIMNIINEYGNEYKIDFIERTLHKNSKLVKWQTNDNLLELELKAFIESVRENKPPLVGIEDAIKSLRVAKEIEGLCDIN